MPKSYRKAGAGDVTWNKILSRWTLVEADLHSEYSIDVEDPTLLHTRTGRWMETRVLGLLSSDTRLARSLAPPPDKRQQQQQRQRRLRRLR